MFSRCVHGNVLDYPTAIIWVNINGVTRYVRAGVSSTLPRPIFLGHDFGDLCLLMSTNYCRRKAVQQREREEAISLVKRFTRNTVT